MDDCHAQTATRGEQGNSPLKTYEQNKSIIKFEVEGYECFRCGHKWIPRSEDHPTICPKCNVAHVICFPRELA